MERNKENDYVSHSIKAHVIRMKEQGYSFKGVFNADNDEEAEKIGKIREEARENGKGTSVVLKQKNTKERIFALFVEK